MGLYELFGLEGKIAIVTGGYGHLGQDMCRALEDAGAIVYLAGRNEEKCKDVSALISKKGRIFPIVMDIASEESIKYACDQIIERHNQIDILVNNASRSAANVFHEMKMEEWNAGIDGSVSGVFRVTKEILPIMVKNGGGSIINIASMYGVVSPNPSIYGDTGFDNPINYGVGKAGIIQFTKYIACHYGEKGIRINAISPGPFPSKKVQENKWFIEQLSKKNPMKRIGRPEELQGVIVFLASNASSYITGQNISVDGGWTAW